MRILLTIDVEAHRVFDEISGVDHDSLGDILDALKAASCRATFFVDLAETHTWGEAAIRRACDRIIEGGHELELHLHPHHHPAGDSNRWLLHEYSSDRQHRLIQEAVSQYVDWFGKKPRAFRAGGFGADATTLRALLREGVEIDSSVLWRRPSCGLRAISHQGPLHVEGMREFPLSHVIVLGRREWPVRVAALDFNWLPLLVLKWTLKRMAAEHMPVAVILLHSSSMYVRVGRKRFVYVPGFRRKLQKLLAYANRLGDVGTVAEANDAIAADGDPRSGVAIRLPYGLQYVVLLYQSVVGCGISASFRAFLLAHVVGVVILISLWTLR